MINILQNWLIVSKYFERMNLKLLNSVLSRNIPCFDLKDNSADTSQLGGEINGNTVGPRRTQQKSFIGLQSFQ